MSNVYAVGTIGFDFGTEARRDTFRQLMPNSGSEVNGTPTRAQPNPYDPLQLADYLDSRPSESTKVIWTLNLDLTPIYAIEAETAYPEVVYSVLRDALRNHAIPRDERNHVSRVSVPGVLTSRTTRLFSGQVVPVVVSHPRGLSEWNEPSIVDSVVDAIRATKPDIDKAHVSQLVHSSLDKAYNYCRNRGQSPPDRALNYVATNALMLPSGIANGLLSEQALSEDRNNLYTLDAIHVSKSPFCRIDSDCWDVRVTLFDPEDNRRARCVQQFTIDVSDTLPVSLAPAHQFLTAD